MATLTAEQQLSVKHQMSYLKALVDLLLFLAFLALCVYLFLRGLIPKGFGGAGAFTWSCTLLLTVACFLGVSALFPWALPMVASVIGLMVLISHFWKTKPEDRGVLYELRRFLLKVCGPAGATYFGLTWLALVTTTLSLDKIIALSLICFAVMPPVAFLFIISGIVAICAAYAVYGDDKKPGNWHGFISSVLGSGGATHWFLSFLIFTGVTIANPLIIIIPAVVMICATVVWYFEKSLKEAKELSNNNTLTKPNLTSFVLPGTNQVRTKDITEQPEVSAKSHPEASTTFQQQTLQL